MNVSIPFAMNHGQRVNAAKEPGGVGGKWHNPFDLIRSEQFVQLMQSFLVREI